MKVTGKGLPVQNKTRTFEATLFEFLLKAHFCLAISAIDNGLGC